MAQLPFPDAEPQVLPVDPAPVPPPRAIGVRKVLLGVALVVVTIALVCFILFGTRTARRLGQHSQPPRAEAAPQPVRADNPLRGLETDYSTAVLRKRPAPTPAPPPVAAAPPPPPSPSAPPARQRERPAGLLVLEGKQSAPARPAPSRSAAPLSAASSEAGSLPPGPESPRPDTPQEGFLRRAQQAQDSTVAGRLHPLPSPFTIQATTVIPASLVTGINSDLPGPIAARVREEVRDSVSGAYVLIPQGSRLLGTYDSAVIYGQNRVLIAWQRLLLPNGDSLALEGMPGTDVGGYAGLKDQVNHHIWSLLGAVLMSSVLSVGSQLPFGNVQSTWPTLPQDFAQEFAQGANRAGQRIVDRELSRRPTLQIRPGMSLLVFVHKDMVLQPYTGRPAAAQAVQHAR